MSVSLASTIEAKLNGSDWTDITADVLIAEGYKWRRGIWGVGPKSRIAGTGKLLCKLNNGQNNSGGLLGYYSPAHANARSGFELGLPMRVKYVYDGDTFYKWYGLLDYANPEMGQYRDRKVHMGALDYMNIMANYKLSQIEVQANKRPDEVLATIVAALPIAPLNTDYDVDPDTYLRSLHTERDESITARTVAQKLAMSSYGFVFVGDDETLRWQSRHDRLTTVALSATLDDTMTGLEVIRDAKNIYNTVKAITYPNDVNEGATLYTSRREIIIQPGATHNFIASFTDASSAGRRLPGSENHVTPVKDTHYRASATEGGSGADLSDDCAVVVGWGSNSADVAITNNSAVTMYVNLFYLEGDALLLYDPVISEDTDTTSRDVHGNRILRYDMPYQDNPNVGETFRDHLLNLHKDPANEIKIIRFVANSSDALMTAACEVDIGERIKLIETLTGLSTEFFVNGIEHEIIEKILTVTWAVERTPTAKAWSLGDAGKSELGDTTWLTF